MRESFCNTHGVKVLLIIAELLQQVAAAPCVRPAGQLTVGFRANMAAGGPALIKWYFQGICYISYLVNKLSVR
jgi:hypothetical protein